MNRRTAIDHLARTRQALDATYRAMWPEPVQEGKPEWAAYAEVGTALQNLQDALDDLATTSGLTPHDPWIGTVTTNAQPLATTATAPARTTGA